MLTADLVQARVRDGRVALTPLQGARLKRAHELAAVFLAITRSHAGKTREELDQASRSVPLGPRDRRLALGLLKLILDRCEFEMEGSIDPRELRRDVFARAARARMSVGADGAFDRRTVLSEIAHARQCSVEELDRALFADLKAAHKLLAFRAIDPDRLVAEYERAQAQAVLLRAVNVRVHVENRNPTAYRRLFRKIKFLRLLHEIAPESSGYRIDIDGPYSLFSSVTKYGLQLALLLPTLQECDRWSLQADVRWGKERRPARFELSGCSTETSPTDERVPLAEEVAILLQRFNQRPTRWTAEPSSSVVSLPGLGVCVPDLTFTHSDHEVRVHLEALGYWSRGAVWKRVELVEAGLSEPFVFAVPARLRVSQEALDDGLPSALYVYKKALSPAIVEAKLDTVATAALARGRR